MVRKVTLRDVAEYAGVSVTTVSNVMRGWPYITETTRQKVKAAIHELGYVPHPIAQGLRSGRTQTIGFIVPDLAQPYFASLVSTVEDVAHEHGYCVLVFNTHEDETREKEGVRRLTNGWGDGMLIVQTANALQTTNLLEQVSIPVVAIDRVQSDFSGTYCNVDNFEVAKMVMQHLVDLGHRRIAHLAGPVYALSAGARQDGYLQLIREFGLHYQYVSANPGRWGYEEGYRAMQELLSEDVRPTAVFASNDRIAIGAIHAIHEVGLSIPQDISLVGVDDSEVSQYFNPPLTTVRQPVEPMAQLGIDMLLKLIDGKEIENPHVSLSPILIIRESTASPS